MTSEQLRFAWDQQDLDQFLIVWYEIRIRGRDLDAVKQFWADVPVTQCVPTTQFLESLNQTRARKRDISLFSIMTYICPIIFDWVIVVIHCLVKSKSDQDPDQLALRAEKWSVMWDCWERAEPEISTIVKIQSIFDRIVGENFRRHLVSLEGVIWILDHHCSLPGFDRLIDYVLAKISASPREYSRHAICSIYTSLSGAINPSPTGPFFLPGRYSSADRNNLRAYCYLSERSAYDANHKDSQITDRICQESDLHYYEMESVERTYHYVFWSWKRVLILDRLIPACSQLVRRFCVELAGREICYFYLSINKYTYLPAWRVKQDWSIPNALAGNIAPICNHDLVTHPDDMIMPIRYGSRYQYSVHARLPVLIADVIAQNSLTNHRGDFQRVRDRVQIFRQIIKSNIADDSISELCQKGEFGLTQIWPEENQYLIWTIEPVVFWRKHSRLSWGSRIVSFRTEHRGVSIYWYTIDGVTDLWLINKDGTLRALTCKIDEKLAFRDPADHLEGPIYCGPDYDQEFIVNLPISIVQVMQQVPSTKR